MVLNSVAGDLDESRDRRIVVQRSLKDTRNALQT